MLERRVLRRTGSSSTTAVDLTAVEEPLEIRLLGEPLVTLMRTPGDDARLTIGFLLAEGFIRSADDLVTVAPCGHPGDEHYGNVIDVEPAPSARSRLDALLANRRPSAVSSACGVCGRLTIDDLLTRCRPAPAEPTVSFDLVARAPETLRRRQRLFDSTGGVHAAAALDSAGEVLAAYEDVGRHCAVDKVVGELLLRRKIGPQCAAGRGAPVLLVASGRAGFEIVQKAAVAGIPVVASVSAATSLAIELADRMGLTLASFVRGGTVNVYAHPERLT